MPERKIELIGLGFKIHSVRRNNPKIIEPEDIDPSAVQSATQSSYERMIVLNADSIMRVIGRCTT